MTKSGLILSLDGTGRLYQYVIDKNAPHSRFTRIDSSDAYGYNFGAYLFVNNDTIYSMGGYGYWHHNWNLRYFNSTIRRWEIVPVHNRVHVTRKIYGGYFDGVKGKLFYAHNDSLLEEGLISYSQAKNSQLTQFEFDIRRRLWRTLGLVSKETQQIYAKGFRIGTSPYGEIHLNDSKDKFSVYFINVAKNQIMEWMDLKSRVQLYHFIRNPDFNLENDRIISYFKNDSITVLNSAKRKLKLPVHEKSLRILTAKVYEVPKNKATDWTALPWWLVGGQTILILALGILAIRRRIIYNEVSETKKPQAFFDTHESRVLQALAAQAEQTLSTEQIDEILGTANKSVDLKNKRRSLVIRSINQKFQERFETDEPLIRATRMESDRRMVQYTLQTESARILQDLVGLSLPGHI